MLRLLCSTVLVMLGLAVTAQAAWPTLYIIGDSTVETHRGDHYGWGGKIDKYLKNINVENDALGGTSSRTFRTGGNWQAVLDKLVEGDFVIMQFGHNDGGGLGGNGRFKASLKGVGDETEEVTFDDGKTETVHSYGWYMAQYIKEAKARGAIVIVCSPIPRCLWADNGKCGRSGDDDYGGWAKKVAEQEDAWFIHLNHIVADRFDDFGSEEEVREEFFADHHVHTNEKGAELNAECVIAGLRGQRNCPLYKYMNSRALKVRPYRD